MRYVLWYAMIGVILAVLANSMFFWSADRRTPASAEKVNLPSANSDIEKRLANAINFERIAQTQTTGGSGGPSKQDEDLASAIASKMKNYPAEYNKPGTLHLNESTQIELVIKTNDKQDTAPLFQNLEGEVTKATVLVANDISAQLSGPPDRLQITLRGDKMRTILSPAPVTWIWDVKPIEAWEGPGHSRSHLLHQERQGQRASTDQSPSGHVVG